VVFPVACSTFNEGVALITVDVLFPVAFSVALFVTTGASAGITVDAGVSVGLTVEAGVSEGVVAVWFEAAGVPFSGLVVFPEQPAAKTIAEIRNSIVMTFNIFFILIYL
jgi:hypothetical protein